jgi:hypothetical protein
MAGGPSPTSTSPSNLSSSPYPTGSISSSTSSSPPKLFSPQNTMTADVFSAHTYGMPSAIGERRPTEKNALSMLSSLSDAELGPDVKSRHTIFLRKLPSNSDRDAVRNMLLFAKDLTDCEIVPYARYSDDKGFAIAVAHFQTYEGAKEACDRLNGKRNATNDATLVVEMLPQDALPGAIGSRRNTMDSASVRQGPITNGIASATANVRQSRYNFQNMEKMSPPNGTPGLGNGEFGGSSLFSPTSPVNTSFASGNLGKSVIVSNEADDDDGLLNESFGFAAGGPQLHSNVQRRATNPNPPMPLSRFASLSLNTNGVNGMASPPMPNYASPRATANMHSPGAAMSALSPHSMPPVLNNGPNSGYQQYSQHFARQTYPPVNPADQNPPCNTLYVGNLPMDTSEDELKAVFSKTRGYKRLCFRTKQNGPMCFVEFEDTSFATKALNDLYGYMLHNSVKGGIRLSFSKNPLGVRSGQNSGMGPPSAMTPTTPLSGFGSNVAAPPGFSTATGPPPGLSAPPGLSTPVHSHGHFGAGMYSNGGFGMGQHDMPSPMRQPVAGNGYAGMGGGYSSYMMGR